MFKQLEKIDFSQISLTGIRSLVILGLLMQAPRSLEELREAFINYDIMSDSNSNDILRIDLNTLRAMGCEISRSCKKTNYKYVLEKHPFSLKISSDEIDVLRMVFKKIKNKTDIETLLEYDELFNKIAEKVLDTETKEALIGLCTMKFHNIEQVRKMNDYCKAHKILSLTYKSPTSKHDEQMNVLTEKLVFNNNKIYLYGYDINKNQSVSLLLKRILSVSSVNDGDDIYKKEPIIIKFLLKDFTIAGLNNDESIIEKNEKGYLIEGKYHNDFLAMQRILSFGPSCTVLEPNDFKNKIVETLKRIKEIYNG